MKNYDVNGFRFGMDMADNDFTSTIRAFMEVIERAAVLTIPTKGQLITLWNELSYGLYLLEQHFRHYPEKDFQDTEGKAHTQDWLTHHMKIMVNEELDTYVKEGIAYGYNGELVVLDLRLPEGQRIYMM